MKWTEQEVAVLMANQDKPLDEVAVLLPGKSVKAISVKKVNLGISKSIRWTEDEIEILRDNPDKSLAELAAILPKREINGIKAQRLKLGLPRKNKVYEWTTEEVDILRQHGPHTYTEELCPMLPRHTIEGISHKLKRLKIAKTKEFMSSHGKKYIGHPDRILPPRYKLDQSWTIDELDNTTYQVLIGSILGDGGVIKTNKSITYAFRETHGVDQTDYMLWKHNILSKFEPSNPSSLKDNPQFSTPSHPIFRFIRQEFYNEEEHRKAYIPLKYIEKLDFLGLLIWFLDDGSKVGNSGYNIHSSLFTIEDLNYTVDIINRNFNLTLYVREKKKQKPEYLPAKDIYISVENRKKIKPIWEQLFLEHKIPDCMRYKLEKPS